MTRRRVILLTAALWGLVLTHSNAQKTQPPQPANVHFTIHEYDSDVGISPPLHNLSPRGKPRGNPNRPLLRPGSLASDKLVIDPVLQPSAPAPNTAVQGLGFPGLDVGAYGVAPSDANIAVGPDHIVQMVNVQYAVFNKSGNLQMAPLPLGAIFAGRGLCETLPTSDPIVRYDRLANRWLLSYVAFDLAAFDFHECIAVSTSPDPTGSYYLYDFDFNYRLQDYPKFGVWPDGYYMAGNSFPFGLYFEGADLCAFERAKMLTGAPAKGICVLTNQFFASQLPSDLDGPTPPPPNSPNYFVGLYTYNPGNLAMFRFVPNYANTSATSVTGPFFIPTSAFNLPCGNGGDCIPQVGTTQLLDSLGDRAMHRLAYRNFGTHESLVLNHSVGVNNTVGIRWYEIQNPNGTPLVTQEGTYAPDSDYRWMGSVAMDKVGNIGLGYSKSGTLPPGIYFTGRETNDSPGQMQSEQRIIDGGGSQTGLDRWGDYGSLELDPADDCTFWYTQQYLPADGSFNWATWIAPFKFSSCGANTPNTPPEASITQPPSGASFTQGQTVFFTGTADDNEDGDLSASLVWTSDKDGQIGVGASFSTTALSQNTHIITASAADSGGLQGTDSITITVAAVSSGTPAAPSNLTATAIYSGNGRNRQLQYVTVGWSDNSDNETSFLLQRCTVQGKGANKTCDYSDLATLGTNATSYNDDATASGNTYTYRLAAKNDAGQSTWSNEAGVNVR